ncbi:Ribosomal protein S5 domain 2-type fold, subgroup [Acididesulfobacillus acetoxydans]|uniref:DNA mismatch repair protein MutL n=1 Tax=Acididesulfobacillus acetoxydans TaxID=1561005 RepID=A0A8S0Y3C2_9FIRM|nr:DNA mismatch repair endonuclease MutL [Acididesulfobacillus acetoxydans]CAA7601935.1 Ribosomal protein S5 domain 2-type fold, subgroup [Acididesulfobacillus acetoxydans]CEJ08221.1 DNA mismatch repair protein MutL [Acididesulfobacillus acetoxydans]
MASLIRVLDPQSANRIAAGEVVERPVSVIKELVENSLDAGAKHIEIAVEGRGTSLIRVQDDGSGIPAAEMPLAVLRHATSKIRRVEDLDTLSTLGFRGEALPSIASVSRLALTSRPPGEISGRILRLEGGQRVSFDEIGAPVGTTVSVENLFYNAPARLKFLRSDNTEFGLISDVVGRIALAHPEVAFKLTHPEQTVLQTAGRGRLLESIGTVLGKELARRLLPLSLEQGIWSLAGYLSPPDLVRSSRQAVTFIVNGRCVRSPVLMRALEEGYHTLIPVKLHPLAVLHLKLPASEYDVNVHPAKMEVKFAHEQALADFLTAAVRRTLLDAGRGRRNSHCQRQEAETAAGQSGSPPAPGMAAAGQENPSSDVVAAISEQPGLLSLDVSSRDSSGFRQTTPAADMVAETVQPSTIRLPTEPDPMHPPVAFLSAPAEEPSPTPALFAEATGLTGSNLWPLAQVLNTYILATDGRSLVIVDQHAAHERINYERLLREIRGRKTVSQSLLVPVSLELSLREEQALLEHLLDLAKIGFILEYFGPQTYLLRAVPAETPPDAAEHLLRRFLEEILQTGVQPGYERLFETWIYLLACRESVKARESLSIPEMEQLLARLAETENPQTCPHGRPTMIQISRGELERRFYRR